MSRFESLPLPLQRAIRLQHADLVRELRARPGSTQRMPMPAAPMEERPLRRTLVVDLPGLNLVSWNHMMGGALRKRREGESEESYEASKPERTKRAIQSRQKKESQAAVAAVPDSAIWRVQEPVRVSIIQFDPSVATRRRDTDNLCGKALLDALVARGVIGDDECRIAPSVTHVLSPAREVGVRVVVQTLDWDQLWRWLGCDDLAGGGCEA